MTDLITRAWNSTPISRRTTDGYVNATAMAKANNKEWHNYFKSDRATTYLEALSRNLQISVTDLYLAKQGEGTWIHPRVAIDFARWISAEFAVWMDGWFLEELAAKQQPVVLALPIEKTLEAVERSVSLFERLGGMDERDQLLFKDIVRTNLLTASSGGGTGILIGGAEAQEITISDAWLQVFGSPLKRDQAPKIGKDVAAKYREEFNSEPPKRTQYVDGAPRSVFSYKRDWLIPLLQRVKSKYLNLPE